MPSLNIDLDFFNHPKTKRLRCLLGAGGEIYLIRLWAYVGKYHAEDGVLNKYAPDEIKMLVDFPGNGQAMLEALLKVGFLKKTKKGYQVHDWLEHEGHLITFQRRAKMAAASRWGHRINKETFGKADATSNATSNALAVHSIAVHSIAEKRGGEAQTPPTIDQVRALAEAEGLKADPDKFFHWQESKAWAGMINWQAAFRYWEKTEFEKPAIPVKAAPAVNPADSYFREQAKVDKIEAWHNKHTQGGKCAFCGLLIAKFGMCGCVRYQTELEKFKCKSLEVKV